MASWLPSNFEEWIRKATKRLDALERNSAKTPVSDVRTMLGGSLPAGYLWMEGQSLLRDDYPALFAAIGTTYGAVDATHFSLPNTKGRVLVGMDAGQTQFNAIGKTGGANTHTLTAAESGLRDHNHFQSHASTTGGNAGLQAAINLAGVTQNYQTTSGSGNFNAINAHNNLQPFLVVRYAIRVI